MADHLEKYMWLLWTIASSLMSFNYLSLEATIAFFLSGLIMSSKNLAEDFIKLHEEEDKPNERNH
jgi:hypothetical protein